MGMGDTDKGDTKSLDDAGGFDMPPHTPKPAVITPKLRQKLVAFSGLYGAGIEGEGASFHTRDHRALSPDGKPKQHHTGYEPLVLAGLLTAKYNRAGEHDETVTYALTPDGQLALKGE